MAASSSSVNVNTENEGKQQDSDSEEGPECAVCLQTCVLPTRLPCRHVFCFLCAKGLALQSRRCAMCRADIPQEFLECPELVEAKPPKAGTSNCKSNGEGATAQEEIPPDKNYAWFYEGRNGWWQYEARLSEELESAYQAGARTHDALIAGSIYTLDFNNWMQCRRDDPARRRRIKRDLASCQHKGVAGLRQLASGQVGDGDASVPTVQTTGVAQMQPTPQVGVPIQVHQQATYMAIPVSTQQRPVNTNYPQTQTRIGLVGGATSRQVLQPSSDSSSSSASPVSSPDGGPEPRRHVTGASRRVVSAGTGLVRMLRGTSISAESSQRPRATHSTRASEQVLPSTAGSWMTRIPQRTRRSPVMRTQMNNYDSSSSSEEDPTS